MVKYSVEHFADFYRGMRKIVQLLEAVELPKNIRIYLERSAQLLREAPLAELAASTKLRRYTRRENLRYGYFLRGKYRNNTLELIDIFSRLDAWYSMAVAMTTYRLSFPEFVEQDTPLVEAKGLYHVLIPDYI